MKLELAGSRIRATWPRYPKSTHDEIVRRLKLLGAEFDKEGSCWWILPSKADKLIDLFPNASYDYDAICAACAAESGRNEAFWRFLVSAGVKLRCDESGAACAVGENVSPLVAEEVRKRSDALPAWVGAKVGTASAQRAAPEVEVTDEDKRFWPLLKGIKNAYAVEQERSERASARRRKGNYRQGRLGL